MRERPPIRSTPEVAGPKVIGCSGRTLRRWYAFNPDSVPYIYRAGRRLFVSTPKLHAEIHGDAAGPWTACQGCFALGTERVP